MATKSEKRSRCFYQNPIQSKGFDDQEDSAEICPKPPTMKSHMSLTFQRPKTLWLQRQPNSLRKSIPRRNKLDHLPSSGTLTMKLAKKIKFTLVFIMDIKVNNHETKQRCKEALLPGLAKANTLTRSHGEKTVCI
ncbi:hypothetical protein E2I00_016094 [Balaenoptera physalus]|uniref:Large ribosomal subunit protein uL23 N-terminal domain-containing protein n=1 Tax=Balaenoptera physalus TaxID=9770 RepID=A0A643BQ58_BALPH|nr:hypothetical protein E2I00_016094 [Balaenoptera physalus]